MRKTLAAAATLAALVSPASAMDFEVFAAPNGNKVVHMTGEIVDGDAKRFIAVLERHPTIVLASLESPGGFTNEGHSIALAVRALNIQTVVHSGVTCESACFEIFAAGTHRIVGENAKVGVHRARYGAEEDVKSQAYSIQYAAMMQSYGVPKSILASLLLQPANGMYYLTKADLNEMKVEWESPTTQATTQTAPYSVVFKQPTTQSSQAPAAAPASTQTETETVDPVLEKMQQFDDAYAKATAVSRAQNRGRPATTRNCDRKSCEEILGFRDKNGQYVELHRSLVTSSRFVCRLTQEGVFNDEYRCTNYLTGEAKIYRWSRDPLL